MNKEIKEKWIEALRSGNYEQAKGSLKILYKNKETPNHCCLGVLCEIMKLEEKTYDFDYGQETKFFFFFLNDKGNMFNLPSTFREYINLDSIDANLLADMNDHGKSFIEIADYIEDNL